MNYTWTTQIDKLMLWKTNSWVKYEQKLSALVLRVHYDQLFITTENKIVESFNMSSKMKGVYKNDVLILIVSVTGQEMRKLKFKIISNVAQAIEYLGKCFTVVCHTINNSNRVIPVKYHTLEDVLKNALTVKDSIPMPEDYNNFVKLCLLDPTFPQIVAETEKILHSKFKEK